VEAFCHSTEVRKSRFPHPQVVRKGCDTSIPNQEENGTMLIGEGVNVGDRVGFYRDHLGSAMYPRSTVTDTSS